MNNFFPDVFSFCKETRRQELYQESKKLLVEKLDWYIDDEQSNKIRGFSIDTEKQNIKKLKDDLANMDKLLMDSHMDKSAFMDVLDKCIFY